MTDVQLPPVQARPDTSPPDLARAVDHVVRLLQKQLQAGGEGATVHVQEDEPTASATGELWFRTTDAAWLVWDGDSWEATTAEAAEHALGGSSHTAATLAELNALVSDATLDDADDARDPTAHAASHEDGGADEIDVAGLSGELADPQTPKSHTHDDRYYTESEVDTLLGDKADVGHEHAASEVTSGSFADGRISESSVTQHEAELEIGASQVTAGTFGAGDYEFPGALEIGGELKVPANTRLYLDGGTDDYFVLNASGPYIQCVVNGTETWRARTGKLQTFGDLEARGHGTTASGANCHIDSSTGLFSRSTSSLRYKDDVRTLPLVEARRLLALRGIGYRSTSLLDDPHREWTGFAAEEMAEAAPAYVELNAEAEPESVLYDRLTVPLLLLVQDHERRLLRLENAA